MENVTKLENNIKGSNESPIDKFKAYPYRWVVLVLFMLVGAMTQVIWITFAAITDESAAFYNVSDMHILMLSVVFMIAYLPFNFLACYLIDKLGLKWGTGIGVILTGVFGFLRALTATVWVNYWLLLVFQILAAIGQPFVLNSFTKLAATWFPEKEKTLAAGLGTIATLLGVIIAFLTTPYLLGANVPYRMGWVLYSFGIAALVAMVLFLLFVKEKPETPPNAYSDKSRVLATKGTFSLFKKRDFNLLFVILFIGLGSFNAISSVLDIIFKYEPGKPQPGLIGGIMIIGGILGALVMSTLSDKYRKRKIFIILSMTGGAVLTGLLYFIDNDISRYIVSFFYGFLLVSALPVGLTFAAEITHPVPEETSNGLMMWVGQIGGIILLGCIMLTDIFNDALMYINIAIIITLFAIGVILSFFMKDLDAYEI